MTVSHSSFSTNFYTSSALATQKALHSQILFVTISTKLPFASLTCQIQNNVSMVGSLRTEKVPHHPLLAFSQSHSCSQTYSFVSNLTLTLTLTNTHILTFLQSHSCSPFSHSRILTLAFSLAIRVRVSPSHTCSHILAISLTPARSITFPVSHLLSYSCNLSHTRSLDHFPRLTLLFAR